MYVYDIEISVTKNMALKYPSVVSNNLQVNFRTLKVKESIVFFVTNEGEKFIVH